MSAGRGGAIVPVGLGFRTGKGGAVVVGVAWAGDEPRVVLSSFLATTAEGDRLSLEPYHVAAEMKRGPDGRASAEALAAVDEGRKRQEQLAAKGLGDIARELREEGYEPVVAALLVNRAGWITDLVEYSFSWREHTPVAEGLAVRHALRFAFGRCRVEFADVDEKSLREVASRKLQKSSAEIDKCLKALGATVGRPWRKEQKLACLSAWLSVAERE
jgi:hypothetical protein